VYIQQQDVRLARFDPTQHLAAMGYFADDLNISMLRQKPAEALPKGSMSSSDEHRDRVHTQKILLFLRGEITYS
jgi:hypothetical protein